MKEKVSFDAVTGVDGIDSIDSISMRVRANDTEKGSSVLQAELISGASALVVLGRIRGKQ